MFNCHNPKVLTLLILLHLALTHLHEHKFKHSFHDSNPTAIVEMVTLEHVFISSSIAPISLTQDWLALLISLRNIDATILQSDANVTHVLLLATFLLIKTFNILILEATIEYVVGTGRFDEPVFNNFETK